MVGKGMRSFCGGAMLTRHKVMCACLCLQPPSFNSRHLQNGESKQPSEGLNNPCQAMQSTLLWGLLPRSYVKQPVIWVNWPLVWGTTFFITPFLWRGQQVTNASACTVYKKMISENHLATNLTSGPCSPSNCTGIAMMWGANLLQHDPQTTIIFSTVNCTRVKAKSTVGGNQHD